MKLGGRLRYGSKKNSFNFGADPHHEWKRAFSTILVDFSEKNSLILKEIRDI